MRTLRYGIIAIALLCGCRVSAQTVTYTNFLRQKQYPSLVQYDASVASAGSQLSALSIEPGGATFELWTVANTSPLSGYLLNTVYVGAYIPVVTVLLRSEDSSSSVPRTRADRPFYVDYAVSGLLTGTTNPPASKSVNLLRYVQSYGVGGTDVGIQRSQATLLSQASITTNGTQTLTFPLTSVPGADRSKVRGEERFSVYSIADYQAPSAILASQYIQIWPVADGSISGITTNQLVRYALPPLTLTLNDLYPTSTTYAQVYMGEAQLGTVGTIVPGSALVICSSVPQSRVLTLNQCDSVFTADGRWTIELLTVTPFGIDRLSYVTFNLNRIITMNSNFSKCE